MARTAAKTRTSDDPSAGQIIAGALKRVSARKAEVETTKKKGGKAGGKAIHGVDNNNVHTANASSRQVDGVDSVDRGSDVPTQWRRPSNLDAPATRAGYVQRWVRYRSGNAEDMDNLEKAMDQGWRPVEKSTSKAGHELTARTSGQYGKYYVKRGLMLMEMPEKLAAQRNAFYAQKLKTMTESVDRDLMKDNNSIMPVLRPERKTRTTRAAKRGSLEASIPDDDE